MTLLCRHAIPLGRFRFVTSDTLANFVQYPQIVLGLGESMVCRLAVPFEGCPVILTHLSAIGVHLSQRVCRLSISALRFGFGLLKIWKLLRVRKNFFTLIMARSIPRHRQ